MFSLIPGYLLQKRIIGDVDPAWYADAMDALLRISGACCWPRPGERGTSASCAPEGWGCGSAQFDMRKRRGSYRSAKAPDTPQRSTPNASSTPAPEPGGCSTLRSSAPDLRIAIDRKAHV